MEYTQLKADAFQALQMNAGIMVDSFTPSTGAYGNILAVTSGGISFSANPTYQDFGEDIDNCPPNTKQLKVLQYVDPKLSGTFVCMSDGLAASLMGGAYAGADGLLTPPNRGFIPSAAFDDVWLIGDYSDKNISGGSGTAGFVAIHIRDGLNTAGFQWQTQKDGKGQFAFEYHAHYDINNPEAVPYEVYVKAGTAASLASITVTSASGASSGKSKITCSGYSLGSGESYVYATAPSTAPSVAYGQYVGGWSALTSGSDITPTTGHTKITVVAKNASGQAVASGTATLVIAS